MNSIFAKNGSFLVILAALAQLAAGIAVVGIGLPAQAEINTGNTDPKTLLSISELSLQQTETATLAPESFAASTQTSVVEAPIIDSLAASGAQPIISGSAFTRLQQEIPATNEPNPTKLENNIGSQQLQTTPPKKAAMPAAGAYVPAPVPGTTATSAAALTTPRDRQLAPAPKTADVDEVAQIDVEPGTPTFGGNSYIGIAGNIGLDGNSALGDTSFMVISKVGLTTRIAVRPSVAIDNDPVFLIPLTYDFTLRPVDAFTRRLPIAPYVGAGVAFSTGNNSDVGPLLTAGADLPITSRFTATAAVNAAFLDKTDIGILIGIGYNFSALGL